MQFVLSLILLVGCSYLGYGLGHYYTLRHQFITDLITFTNLLKVEISFLKDDLLKIIKEKTTQFSPSFKAVLKGYIKTIEENEMVTMETLKKNISTSYLENAEYHTLLQFFNGLGKTDAISQVEALDKFLLFFYTYLKNASKERQKYAGMFQKLGVLTGIFLVIVLL